MGNRILISGGSIAGLTLAHWLARYGFRPTVVERAPGIRPGGNGVDVRGHAAQVLDRMGLLDEVRAAAADVVGMKFVNARDRVRGRVDTRGSAIEIPRGDLVALLHRAADVEYLFGDSIRELDQDDTGVTVTFATARPRRFDLVIGADGLHSAVRRLAFGPEERFVRHLGHHFAFAAADPSLGEDRWVTIHNLPGRMAGVYRSGNHPDAKAYFTFRGGPLPRGGAEQRLREVFGAERSWRIPELLATTLADPDRYVDAVGQVRLDSWSRGRVGLAGDAAHCASPASGAGAELALVGAYRLAGELADADGDHTRAFPRYEQSHRPLVDDRQRIGPALRLLVPRTTTGRRVRDTLARTGVLAALTGLARLAEPGTVAPLPTHAAPESANPRL